MKEAQREVLKAVFQQRSKDLESIGPNAAHRLAKARLINAGMARYTDGGEFVWMPEYGGPEL